MLTEINRLLSKRINQFPQGATRDRVMSHIDLFTALGAKLRQLNEGLELSIHKPSDKYPAYFYAVLPADQEAQGVIKTILDEHANTLSTADGNMFNGSYELVSLKHEGTQEHKEWGIAIDFQGKMFAKLPSEEEDK